MCYDPHLIPNSYISMMLRASLGNDRCNIFGVILHKGDGHGYP